MLKFPLRVEYALRALMDLASHTDDGPVPARAIAERQRIPVRVLEHQLAALNKAGLVGAQRGAHGGYELAHGADRIRISDVIEVIEGPIAPMYCLDPHEDEQCSETHRCGLQHLWIRVASHAPTVAVADGDDALDDRRVTRTRRTARAARSPRTKLFLHIP
jgi:Rrf2 family protein